MITCNEDQQTKIEFLANLNRHTKAVNVVRFSPKGKLILNLKTLSNNVIISTERRGRIHVLSVQVEKDFHCLKYNYNEGFSFQMILFYVYDNQIAIRS